MGKKEDENNLELISMRGNREMWLDFTHKIRKDRKKVWDILQPMIKDYMKKGKR